MSGEILLKAEKRTRSGSAESRRLRRAGRMPAVLCRKNGTAESLHLDTHEFNVMLHHHTSEHLLAGLFVEGGGQINVLLKEVQHHPISRLPVHADFKEVSLDEKVQVEVPLEFVGEAAGVKKGGVLEAVLHSIEIECLPGDLPESVRVDVSALEIGHMLNAEDIALDPAKFMLVTEGHQGVVHVAAPRTEDEPQAATEETEPEVIAAKKREEAE